MFTLMLFAVLTFFQATSSAQQGQQPDHSRQQEVIKRGEHVMGFSHEKTAHHFVLFRDGGQIVVAANDPSDVASMDQIRMHLSHIAKMFSAGNFNAPMLIHDTNPPGVSTMTRLKDAIRFEFSETERGAQIRMTTTNPQAIDAVHAFLLFQIIDHQTGDTPAITNDAQR